MSTYYAGTAVLTTCTFTAPGGALTDPTVVTLKYAIQGQAPTVVAEADLNHVSTGVWNYTIDTTALIGPVTVEWIGTEACAAVNAVSMTVVVDPL